jgi:poly(3-hydroxyalkanoate) synthetase
MYPNQKTTTSNDITIRLTNDEVKIGKLIGKTKSMVFLQHKVHVLALPIESSVLEIRILR